MNILKVLTERRKTGNVGERAAAKFLKRQGYIILKRNYVTLGHEIDIIARDRLHTVFVEVKTRTLGAENANEPRPASSVTPKKQKGIILAACEYLAMNPSEGRRRFDIIEVYLDKNKKVQKILHLEGAFNRNTAGER